MMLSLTLLFGLVNDPITDLPAEVGNGERLKSAVPVVAKNVP